MSLDEVGMRLDEVHITYEPYVILQIHARAF